MPVRLSSISFGATKLEIFSRCKSHLHDADMVIAFLDMELIGRIVELGHKVFPGDCYSSGPAATPLSCLSVCLSRKVP